jgi:uncharacterized membrane protein
LDISPVIQIHLAAALYVVIIAPIAVFRPRRYIAHKILGFIWVLAMGLLAGSSFAIAENGRFSLIHLLSCLVLVSLVRGLRSIRQRLIVAHARHMRALYLQALLGAGGVPFCQITPRADYCFHKTPGWGSPV